jgi:hypothetical protein
VGGLPKATLYEEVSDPDGLNEGRHATHAWIKDGGNVSVFGIDSRIEQLRSS